MVKGGRTAIAALSLSASALVGIAGWEQYRGEAYLPTPQDVPTLGWGSTDGVKLGARTTPDRALIRLLADADKHQRELKRCIGDVPLFQHEFDAFTSWAYNVGVGAACGSTLIRLLNQGEYRAACDQLMRWNRAGGREVRGLTLRRQQERAQCLQSIPQPKGLA